MTYGRVGHGFTIGRQQTIAMANMTRGKPLWRKAAAMLSKNNSLLRLVKILLGKRKLSVPQIARKLGVTERTVYRHLNTLEEMGWKIGCDNGYFILRRTKCPMCGKPV